MTIDAFAFPKTDKPEQIQAQHKLAELMMDPAVQTEFTRYKGSVPSRLDANIAVLDRCAKQGRQVMALGPSHQLPAFLSGVHADSYGQSQSHLLAQYWANPNMSAAGRHEEVASIIRQRGRLSFRQGRTRDDESALARRHRRGGDARCERNVGAEGGRDPLLHEQRRIAGDPACSPRSTTSAAAPGG